MTSDKPFNPYHKWLGIPPEDQPPHYYRLLALQLFEDDPEVIQSAADQRMAHVRTFQTGTHSEDSQKILNELAAARICLLKPERKAVYDAELKVKLTPKAISAPAAAVFPPVAPPVAAAPPPDVPLSPALRSIPIASPPAPPVPAAPLLPPAYTRLPTSWNEPLPPAAIPVIQPGTPMAIPVQPPDETRETEPETDDLPFELPTGRSIRNSRNTRTNNSLPLLLFMIGVLLFVSTVAAILMGKRENQPRSSNREVSRNRRPSETHRAPTPSKALPARKPGREPRPELPSRPASTRPAPPTPKPIGESLAIPFPGHVRQLPSVIDNADRSGFALSGEGWQTLAMGDRAFRGSLAVCSAQRGAPAATWTFDGLEPGKRYKIFITWSAGATGDRLTWYGIRDGELGSHFLMVDQNAPPRSDVLADGYPFQDLATVRITSGILTVRLEGGDGQDLQADAILLVAVPDSDSPKE